jgi:hypothetical protein
MAKKITLELTKPQAIALRYTLRVAHDMAFESDLKHVRKDDRLLAALREKLAAAAKS